MELNLLFKIFSTVILKRFILKATLGDFVCIKFKVKRKIQVRSTAEFNVLRCLDHVTSYSLRCLEPLLTCPKLKRAH